MPSFLFIKLRGESMKELLKYIQPYRTLAILAPLCMLLEVASELAMPKLMTYLINQGVGTGDTGDRC